MDHIDTNELVADLGLAITEVLKQHGIKDKEVRVRVNESDIRILVQLEDDEFEV